MDPPFVEREPSQISSAFIGEEFVIHLPHGFWPSNLLSHYTCSSAFQFIFAQKSQQIHHLSLCSIALIQPSLYIPLRILD